MIRSMQTKMHTLRPYWNSFRIATWLGWQIESNWTDPFLFAVYSLIKPLAGAAILVVMYGVITQGNFQDPMFTYMYLGNAFYIYVGAILNGMAWAVIDDREHYRTLKYIYTAPIHFPTYLFGRSVATFLVSSVAVLVTVLVGIFFLQVQFSLAAVNFPLFALSLLIGVIMLGFMGLILAGAMLLMVHHMWDLGPAVAGALYLFSGAIFPLSILPPAIRWIGYLMPITYWLELLRRSLVGTIADQFPTLTSVSDQQLLGILLLLTVLFSLIAIFSFRWCENLAREKGVIDTITNY
jgi:ABC-2 type transport system permease protein